MSKRTIGRAIGGRTSIFRDRKDGKLRVIQRRKRRELTLAKAMLDEDDGGSSSNDDMAVKTKRKHLDKIPVLQHTCPPVDDESCARQVPLIEDKIDEEGDDEVSCQLHFLVVQGVQAFSFLWLAYRCPLLA